MGRRVARAHVKERAARQLRLEEPCVELGLRLEAQRCCDLNDLADGAVLDELADGPCGWEEARPHALHQEEALLLRLRDALFRLCRVDDHGLLAEHILACLEAQHDVVAVEGMRRGDVDNIDGVIGDEGFVRVVRLREAMLCLELICSRLRAARHGMQFCIAGELQCQTKVVGNGPRRHDAPFHMFHSLLLFRGWHRRSGRTASCDYFVPSEP